jgi:hypothetical protein
MLRAILVLQIAALLLIPAGGHAADLCARSGTPEAQVLRDEDACSNGMRMAEGSSNKTCTESCISQCRNAERNCSSGECKAQFQICARRCVVSCGGR